MGSEIVVRNLLSLGTEEMMNHIQENQKLLVVLIVVISILYLFSGTSDRMDTSITAKQQHEVIARLGLK